MLGADTNLFNSSDEIEGKKDQIAENMQKLATPFDAVTAFPGKGI
jgi:hypothetical protein